MKNNLMIGNLVFDGDKIITIKTGSQIDESDKYEPIPLTDENIEFLCFRQIKTMATFNIIDALTVKEYYSRLMKGVSIFYIIKTKDFVFTSGSVGVKIKYLHELQNIFTVMLNHELNTHNFWFKHFQLQTQMKNNE